MSAANLESVLDQVKLVVFQTRIVSPIRDTGEGTKRGDSGSRIEKVLQKCFDPATLRPLARLKQEAMRTCRNYGTKVETLNAWAVPIERTNDLLEHLAKIEDSWNLIAKDLADNIHKNVEEWAKANSSEAHVIHELAPSREEVIEATRFIKTSFRLRGQDVEDDGCLGAEMSSLACQTMREISQVLRDSSLDKSSGSQYSQCVKDVLRRVQIKAQSLSFLDPRLEEVSSVLNSTMDLLPHSGKITSTAAILVKSVIDQLLKPNVLMRDGFKKIGQAQNDEDVQEPSDNFVLCNTDSSIPAAAVNW